MEFDGTALVLALVLISRILQAYVGLGHGGSCGRQKQLPRQGVKNPRAGVWVLNISFSEGGSLDLTETLIGPHCPGCGTV